MLNFCVLLNADAIAGIAPGPDINCQEDLHIDIAAINTFTPGKDASDPISNLNIQFEKPDLRVNPALPELDSSYNPMANIEEPPLPPEGLSFVSVNNNNTNTFNENQELPDLEDTDNVAEIVEAAKDPEKAEDVVKKVRKKRWDAGKTAEEKQKIREERDRRRESTAQPLAPVGELTPELDIDSVLRQAEDSGLMDHIHEQIEGHGKDNPFHTKEDTVKAIKAKYKTPEKMKEYLGKQHGKFETFKAKAKATEEKQEAKAERDRQLGRGGIN